MKNIISLCAAAAIAGLLAACQPAPSTSGEIEVTDAWTWSLETTNKPGAAYMSLKNDQTEDDRLVSVSIDESIATHVEIHTTQMDDGVMRMRHLEDGITLPAGEVTEFRPGGNHLMLFGLQEPLAEGETLTATLTFEDAGEKIVAFKISDGPPELHSDHDHH